MDLPKTSAKPSTGNLLIAGKRTAVTAEIADPLIRLHKGPEMIFEEDFSDRLAGKSHRRRKKWLAHRSILLLDEYDDGAFDTNGELDPWEPD